MAVINFQEGMRQGRMSPFWAARGKAIQSYSNVEQSLCRVFSLVSDTNHDVAAIIFFKITSTAAQTSIIEKLLQKKYGTTYNLFWNSYFKLHKPLVNKRNEIVHWKAINVIGADESGTKSKIELRPPPFWGFDPTAPVITIDDLVKFDAACDALQRVANIFYAAVTSTMIDEDSATWVERFKQPLIYPIPSDDMLARIPPGDSILPDDEIKG